jgi:NAD(P)-dependent dehydrogenase (short-subunit alcohol dehydrogenase family)
MAAIRKRALVTGGGSGIGLAIARSFAAAGYDVAVAGRSAAKLAATGLPFIIMDVADAASVAEGLAKTGDLDVFVANAGAAETAPAVKTPDALFERMIAVNLTSVFYCAKAAVPPMTARGAGRFIAIASTAALKGYAYASAYAAAKHGVLGLIRSLAIEIAGTGVTANAICPGFTDTPLVEAAVARIVAKTGRSREEATAALASRNPMARLVRPEEVAAAALYLAGDGAAAVNGQAIVVDGGEAIS